MTLVIGILVYLGLGIISELIVYGITLWCTQRLVDSASEWAATCGESGLSDFLALTADFEARQGALYRIFHRSYILWVVLWPISVPFSLKVEHDLMTEILAFLD